MDDWMVKLDGKCYSGLNDCSQPSTIGKRQLGRLHTPALGSMSSLDYFDKTFIQSCHDKTDETTDFK